MPEMRITMLGCGPSAGVPLIGCDCDVCTSVDSRNKRTRSSVLVETQGKTLLVDASPDLRAQALANQVRHLDAVLFTHTHADHCHGLDELRSFNYLADAPLPIYADRLSYKDLQQKFSYAFQGRPEHTWYRPALEYHEIPMDPCQPFNAVGVNVIPFKQDHGYGHSLGFRIGHMAYSTDVVALDDKAFAQLEGLDLWIVDCLSLTQKPTHSWLEQTLLWIDKVKPKRAILTHMGHELEYFALQERLPENINPAYDGMVLEAA